MLTLILLINCVVICIYKLYEYCVYRPVGFPPGPPRMPIFGSYLFLMLADFKYLHKAALKFSKWYNSDIIGFHVGPARVVAAHCAEGVREIFNNSDLEGRPMIYVTLMRDPNFQTSGILFLDGPAWKEQRRFVLRYLRDFGFGRRFQELELIIQEEITDMLDLIRYGPKYEHEEPYVKEGGLRVLLPYFFNPFSANTVFHIIYKERKSRSEQSYLWELIRLAMKFQRLSDSYGKMLSVIPWIRHIFPNWSCYKPLMEANVAMYKYFEEVVDRHIQTYDESSERNFLDLYIKEIKNSEMQGNADTTTFKRNQFILSLVDFSLPALTSIGLQMSFLVQYLLLYPDVQHKIQQEIDDVVGRGRLPTLDDRKLCNYTEACIREIARIETVVPSDVPRVALRDTQLMGYKIPKDTFIMPSLYVYHNDKRVWGDPQNFRPERFLDDQGKLCLAKDVSFPFGGGKRLCPGETFSRNLLFLMTTALCQNFSFVLGAEDKLPDLSANLSGFSTSPKDFWVQLKERK